MNVARSLGAGWQTQDVVGLLDIGTSKIVSVIVALPRSTHGEVRVLGAGITPSRGLSDGRVVGLDEAEEAVRAAVAAAERVAGVMVRDVLLAVACGELGSQRLTARTRIEGRVVTTADIERMMRAARSYAERDGRALLHVACDAYRLDDAVGIANPRGLAGHRLEAELDAVTADAAALSNLLRVVERAYLKPALVTPTPYASALAATTAEERRRGVIAADIGAGGTALAVFAEGRLVWNSRIPLGGDRITRDLARDLTVSTREAERIKTECGTVAQTAVDADEVVLYVRAGQASALSQSTKGRIREIVRDRLLDLCGRIAEAVHRSGIEQRAIACAVFCGGASQQVGLYELAAEVLGLAVREARIAPLAGMPAEFVGPAFATVAGLAQVARDPAVGMRPDRGRPHAVGYLRRLGQWLQESF